MDLPRWLLILGLLACQRQPEIPALPPSTKPVAAPEPLAAESEAVTPTQPTEVALPDAATDFFDFSDGRTRPGDFLIWHRADDYQPDTTYWLSIQATSTELVGQREGLWIAARDAIWHWNPEVTDLPICGPLACEEEVPHCKPMRRTGGGTVDTCAWRDLLTDRSVPVGPRLPEMAGLGLGATSLHETWLPLAVVNGRLLLRVETHWRLCDGGSGGRVQVKMLTPPMPMLQPLFVTAAVLPPELRTLAQGGQAVWGGIHQGVDDAGRWHIHDEWLIPLPSEVTDAAVETLYTQARVPAERLPGSLTSDARESPSLMHAAIAEGAVEDDAPRWGWSRLQVGAQKRDELRRAFVGEALQGGRK